MNTFLSILAALLLLSILVTIHELGHYTAGRLLGFTIVEFSVGMGPVLLKKMKNGIQYSIRALPIGGMCRFYGEDQEAQDSRCFNAQPAWKRLITIFAGPFMNFVFAIIFSVITLSAYGDYVPSVYAVSDATTPAAISGMQTGDIITAVDGQKVSFYADTVPMILAVESNETTISVLRDGTAVDCKLTNIYNKEQGKNLIGITIEPMRMKFGFTKSIGQSFHYVGTMVKETFGFFGNLFKGQVQSTDVAGPVGIIAYISEAVRYGFETILRFAVLISISLGIMNLLPLPALDGGRMVFIFIEAIRGKPIPAEKEGMVHFVGLILLFGLIIFLTYNDISNLIRGVTY
ncbi:MAG: RIP metalloprotease RseP [Clostridia bacterium]